jgi:hypothetical protein
MGLASVNQALVRSGAARAGGVGAGALGRPLAAAAGRARAAGRGQWGACAEDPTGPLHTVKQVQRRLIALGYLPKGTANGQLDHHTQQALEAFQGWEGIGRTGVLDAATNERLIDPSHPVPLEPGPKHVEVLVTKQVLLLVQGRRVLRAVHVSTGAGGRTPVGSFQVLSKYRSSYSRPFHVWLSWAAYFHGGFALHGYPDVPAYPASHGCIRMPEEEAPIVYDFVTPGTPVLVRYA